MRFGLPRSPSPSPVRGTKSLTKRTKKHRTKLVPPPKAAVSPKPTYRRGTSFGLRDDSDDSNSGSDVEDGPHDGYGGGAYDSSSSDGPVSSSSESSFEEGDSVKLTLSRDGSESSSDESFDFTISTSATGQRLKKLPKGKGKAKGPEVLDEYPTSISASGSKGTGSRLKLEDRDPLRASLERTMRSPEKYKRLDETVASIRMRTRYHDPYEEWEKNTKNEAFKSARRQHETINSSLDASLSQAETNARQTLEAQHRNQMDQVLTQLRRIRLKHDNDESILREQWKKGDKELWERIERVIGIEENKVKARLEEERKKREEEQRKKEEAERVKKEAEDKKRKEIEQQQEAERKRKEEEDRKRQEEEDARKREEEAVKKREEEERLGLAKNQKEREAREAFGYRTSSEEWKLARTTLLQLKDTVMAVVKSDRETKKIFNEYRRKITPKVGQVTNDTDSINRVSTELLQLLRPVPPHRPLVYTALCSSLAKAILLQAETEVTAEKKAALPIAHVAFNLLTTLDGVFREIFWAKYVQRTGGWVIPTVVPYEKDADGRKWGEGPKERGRGRGGAGERWYVMGYRKSESAAEGNSGNGSTRPANLETLAEYTIRISGMVRVYWEIVKVQLRHPDRAFIDGPGSGQGGGGGQSPFGIARFWMWFARMAAVRPLLETGIGAELVHTALEVLGAEAADIWGHQWVKVLQLVYDGATTGLYPERAISEATLTPGAPKENIVLGGKTAEGRAARARVQMEVERIVRGEKKS